jgi:hypothetical protein
MAAHIVLRWVHRIFANLKVCDELRGRVGLVVMLAGISRSWR